MDNNDNYSNFMLFTYETVYLNNCNNYYNYWIWVSKKTNDVIEHDRNSPNVNVSLMHKRILAPFIVMNLQSQQAFILICWSIPFSPNLNNLNTRIRSVSIFYRIAPICIIVLVPVMLSTTVGSDQGHWYSRPCAIASEKSWFLTPLDFFL